MAFQHKRKRSLFQLEHLRKGFPGEGEFSMVPEVCAQIPGTETVASKETA